MYFICTALVDVEKELSEVAYVGSLLSFSDIIGVMATTELCTCCVLVVFGLTLVEDVKPNEEDEEDICRVSLT